MNKIQTLTELKIKGNVKSFTETRYLVIGNQEERQKDAFLFKHVFKYDIKGNLIERIVYDINEDVILEQTFSYSYNDEGKTIECIKEGIGRSVFKHDERGNLIEEEYTEIEKDVFGFDVYEKSEYRYDEKGRLIEKLENGRKIHFQYDEKGMKIRETTDEFYYFDYEYDEVGNLIEEAKYSYPEGDFELAIIYKYDDLNNVEEQSMYSESLFHQICYASDTYDEKGRLIVEDNWGETISYTYDEKGNKLIEHHEGHNIQTPFDSKFDEKGNKIEDSWELEDSLDYSVSKITYCFNENSNVIEQNNCYYKSYEDGWCIETKTIFKYDEKGNEIERNTYESDESLKNKTAFSYFYNEKGDLVEKFTCDIKNNISEKETYFYDDMGNRIIKSEYDTDSKLKSKTIYKYDMEGNKAIENKYLDKGNLLSRKNYKYDKKRRMIQNTEYCYTDFWNDYISSYSKEFELINNSHYKYDINGRKIPGRKSAIAWNLEDKINYEYEGIDKEGNWCKKIEYENGIPMHLIEREMEYYEVSDKKKLTFVSVKPPPRLLKPGIHTVKITDVTEGLSEVKKTKYFACKFENKDGYINNRFYISENSMKLITRLFIVAGVPITPTLYSDDLKGKELKIKIEQKGIGSTTHLEAVEFWKVDEEVLSEMNNDKK